MQIKEQAGSDIPAPSPESDAIGGTALYTVGVLTLVNVVNYMDRTALSVLAPLIQKDLMLSDTELGLLIGLAFSIFYAICGVPLARWADRGVRKNIIALAMLTWSAFTVLSGAATQTWHLFLTRIGVAAGEAGSLPPGQSILCDYIPPLKRPAALATHSFGLMIGSVLGLSLAGWLGHAIGWRLTFVVLGLPGLLLAPIVYFTLREPPRGRLDIAASATAKPLGEPIIAVFTQIARNPTYALLLAFVVANGFAHQGIAVWLPSFYSRSFALDMSVVGPALGLATGVGSAIGLLGGGFFANKLAARSAKLPLLVGAGTVLASAAAITGMLLSRDFTLSITLIALWTLLLQVPAGAVVGVKMTVTPPEIRATASAVTIFLVSVLGFGMGPLCVGVLSDFLSLRFGVDSLRVALIVPVAVIPVMAALLIAAARSMPALGDQK